MQNLLLITNTFPPHPGNSSEKMATRVKHLYKNGWNSIVLTPEIPSTMTPDYGLSEHLPPVLVHRTSYFFKNKYPSFKETRGLYITGRRRTRLDFFYLPNGYIRWLPYAIKAGMNIAPSVDVILSLNNPTTTHLIAYFICSITKKPWVAALRDPICGNPIHRKGPELTNHIIERLVAGKADRIVQWSDFVSEPLSERYPESPSERFVNIPYTGYDPDDFSQLSEDTLHLEKPLKISYTGSFYPGSITPEPILNAIATLIRREKITATDILITFAGDWDSSYNQLVMDLNLTDCVRYLGFISREACIDLWADSHVLLLIMSNKFDSIHRFPAKFWDYVGARRYILGLVPELGRLATLIAEQHLGIVAKPDDVEAIGDAILDLLNKLDQESLIPAPTDEFLLDKANRASGESVLAQALHEAVAQDFSKDSSI